MNKVLLHSGSLDNFIHKGLITPFFEKSEKRFPVVKGNCGLG
jgi:hypothetical protein